MTAMTPVLYPCRYLVRRILVQSPIRKLGPEMLWADPDRTVHLNDGPNSTSDGGTLYVHLNK